jgi:imidazole glycerol-phosphate synthase subunit HisF
MFRPRIIPVLLLKNQGLVKTVKFKKARYIGDPINAVRIFNDLKADELIFLDITATSENRTISLDLIKAIGDEAYMPFAVGGGIRTIDQIGSIFNAGAEKVVICTNAYDNLNFIKSACDHFGSQSIIVSVDCRKKFGGKDVVFTHAGSVRRKIGIQEYIRLIQESGAGEIFLQSIDNDGTMRGYDIELIRKISESLNIPVIACGGAGNLNHIRDVIFEGKASAAAAGSLFVYHGNRNGILINYPDQESIKVIFKKQ